VIAKLQASMSSKEKDVSKLRLVLVQDDSYANPGDYSRTDVKVRDKNIWVCESNSRLMFYAGGSWVITATQYMQEVLDGSTGGFVSSKDADFPYEADWGPNYNVSEVYLSAEGRWVPAPEMPDRYRSPSVHIWWSAPANSEVQREGITWFYNEIAVTETATSTYYMTNGFTGGYMGIQDRYPKWVLFSIWDKTSTDDASPDDLVKVLAKGEGVTVQRFGGEGTGGQSYFAYDWKVGHKYQLMVNVQPDAQESDKAVFTGWFRIPELNVWRLLASFQVRPKAASKKLEGIYSFLEDWSGNGHRRQGLWGPAWIKTDGGPWVQATRGSGSTTEPDANNRNVFLSPDCRQLGMTTGGPALADTSLGPYTCGASSIPSVLTLNPLPDGDGAPARE